MRLGLLLRADRLDAIPVSLKLPVAGIVHVDPRRAAQARQGHHHAADFLIGPPDRPAEHVFDQRQRVVPRASVGLRELERLFQQMIKVGWQRPDSTFRRVFTDLMIPGASEEQAGWLDALQARATSTENAMRSRAAELGGKLEIESAPGGPTALTVAVPVRINQKTDLDSNEETDVDPGTAG